jgi:hypothetical protein
LKHTAVVLHGLSWRRHAGLRLLAHLRLARSVLSACGMRSMLALVVLSSFPGCATDPPSDRELSLQPAPDPSADYRVVMSFASPGVGIDEQALKRTLDTVGIYDIDLSPDVHEWGLEGERNLCFSLRGLNDEAQALFIDQLDDIAQAAVLVTVHENAPCNVLAR